MLHQWVNRLVKSEYRRKQLLGKPRISWPSLLHTGEHGTLKGLSLHRESFPERIQIQIELRPYMVTDLSLTAQSNLDTHESSPTFIYQQLSGNVLRIYSRCSRIDLIVKEWEPIKTEKPENLKLSSPINTALYAKEFYTCNQSIVEFNTVIEHEIVNSITQRKHIYPYGGYLSLEGEIGETVYITLSSNEGKTTLHTHTYSELIRDHLNPLAENTTHVFSDIDPAERHKILPLNKLIEYGEISTYLNLKIGEDVWSQNYQSESMVRKDGTYEATLTLRKTGKPTLGGAQ